MKALLRYFLRKKIGFTLKGQNGVDLQEAIKLWSLSHKLFLGPVGPSAKVFPEFELFQFYSRNRIPAEDQFQMLFSHPSPSVAGYAFEILLSRGSNIAMEVLENLKARSETIESRVGSFVNSCPLGKYVASRLESRQAGPAR